MHTQNLSNVSTELSHVKKAVIQKLNHGADACWDCSVQEVFLTLISHFWCKYLERAVCMSSSTVCKK